MKKLAILGITVAFLGSIFLLMPGSYRNVIKAKVNAIISQDGKDNEENIDKDISLDITPKSISIIKTGNPVRKKVVTSKEDMEKIKDFVASIHLQKKLNESMKGWAYSIDITDTEDRHYGVSFSSYYVAHGDSQYTIDPSVPKKFDAIYSELNYPEVDPLDEHINSPNKIILYKDGKAREIESSDANFNKIVSLTNDRIEKDKLSIAKDGVDINGFVNECKGKNLGIEFIYNEEQELNIKNLNGFTPINYYKLYFNLISDNEYECECEYFQYGDKENYVSSSRGPIKPPDDIVKIINEL